MKPVHFFLNIVSAAGMVALCTYFLDIPLALFVNEIFKKSATWSRYAADIPDTLFLVVCATTLVSLACYHFRARKKVFDRVTRFSQLIAYAVPLTYLLKTVLKSVFGRVNTRVWLVDPELYGFHWFQDPRLGGGFPSGHMAVFSALFAALWRYYPRYRPLCLFFALSLAVALIATNYHFLGDVVGGAYLGILVEAGTDRVLQRHRRSTP